MKWWDQPSVWCKADGWKTEHWPSSYCLMLWGEDQNPTVQWKVTCSPPTISSPAKYSLKKKKKEFKTKNLQLKLKWCKATYSKIYLTCLQTLKFMAVVRDSHLDIFQWQRNWQPPSHLWTRHPSILGITYLKRTHIAPWKCAFFLFLQLE